MADRPSADRTAELLLRFYRDPSRYGAEGGRREAPRLDPEVILKLALGRHVEFADPALNDPHMAGSLIVAAAAYIRNMFFRPDANPYQTLGLAPGAPPAAIRERFRLLMQLVHPDRQGGNKLWPDSCAAQANWAYSMLRDDDSRSRLERDAEARAALARAINRAASEGETSRLPVVTGLNKRKRARRGMRALSRSVLPEWLTAGVGGYTRRNPAVAIFAILIGAAAIFIGATGWDRHDGRLIRDAREPGAPAETIIATKAPVRERAADASAGAAKTIVATMAPQRETTADATAGAAEMVIRRLGNSVAERPLAVESVKSASGGAAPAYERGAPSATDTTVSAATTDAVQPTQTRSSADLASPRATESTAAYVPVAAPASGKAEPAPAPESSGASVAIGAATPLPSAAAPPPATAEIEALFASFVDNYQRGRLDAFAALFDDDADTNLRRGRAAIRGEYDELFRLSQWRRMQLTRISWRPIGDRAVAKGEITVMIGWRDGREVVQRLNVDMELMRRDGHVVIAKLTHQPMAR